MLDWLLILHREWVHNGYKVRRQTRSSYRSVVGETHPGVCVTLSNELSMNRVSRALRSDQRSSPSALVHDHFR